MKICKNCNKEFESKRTDAECCSPACRVSFNRKNKDKPYSLAEGKVYCRQAVIYPNEDKGVTNSQGFQWSTRPMPDNPTDAPDKDNRCIFTKKDETRYIIGVDGKGAEI